MQHLGMYTSRILPEIIKDIPKNKDNNIIGIRDVRVVRE
jgi:hypothetical protein